MTKHYLWTLVSLCLLCLFSPLSAFSEDGAKDVLKIQNTIQKDSIQVRSDNFTLSGKIDGAQGIEMISELERFRSALLETHGLPATSIDQRVDIYVVSDPEIYSILGVDESFVAIYTQTNAGPRALINGSSEAFDASSGSVLRHGLRHEYAHHFTQTYLRLTEPVWLAEGLAEYYAGYVENEDGSYHFGAAHETHEYVLKFPIPSWFDMRDLLGSLGDIKTARLPKNTGLRDWAQRPDDVSFFYAQSWAFTHWMMNKTGQTNIKEGTEQLAALVERLIANDMPVSRDLSSWPTLNALRLESETQDEAIAESVRLELGVPLQLGEKTSRKIDTLESRMADYIKAGVPVFTAQPEADRVTASVSIKTLTPSEAAAIQYRQLSLAAGSRALIHPRMKSLKAEIEADPKTAPSLIISEAAQQFSMGGRQSAVDLMAKAAAQNILTSEDETLALNIAYGDFVNHSYQNPAAMRIKLRQALAQRPNDVSLLVMMAVTGAGDLRSGNDVISIESQTALKTLEEMDVAKTRPLFTLPLVNLYAAQENDKAALALLYRALVFKPSNQSELRSFIRDLESRAEAQRTP